MPEPATHVLREHVTLLRASLLAFTGRDLLDYPGAPSVEADSADAVEAVLAAPYALLSHDARPDPVFTFGNRTVRALFEVTWDELTAMPSRLSAEPVARSERQSLLERVSTDGFIDDYSGVRISSTGRRFRIERAVVWNLTDPSGQHAGQAALFDSWVPCLD